MTKTLCVIYIPGLGDSRIKGQLKAINTWRLWGVRPELFQMNWADGEPWEPKFKRLLKTIDELAASGRAVGLVGASAGGSAVINAYAARKDKVVGAVCISGKINRPQNVHSIHKRRNPAFVTSVNDCQTALQSLKPEDRKRILSVYAISDNVVNKRDSRINGANNRAVPTVGHFFTIASQISLGAPLFIKFLKKQGKLDHY